MNVSGILVVVSPGETSMHMKKLARLEGVDVHHSDPATGRIVITQEADSIAEEVEGLKRIKALPGVILAEMVYHCFEDDAEIFEGIPPEFNKDGDTVPPFLNK